MPSKNLINNELEFTPTFGTQHIFIDISNINKRNKGDYYVLRSRQLSG